MVTRPCRVRHGYELGGDVRARNGKGPCLGGAWDGVACAAAVGRLGMVLVGRGDGGAVHARKVLDSGSGCGATASAGRVRGQA